MYIPRTYELRGPKGEHYYDAPFITQMLGSWIADGWRYYVVNPFTGEVVGKGYKKPHNARKAAEKWAQEEEARRESEGVQG